MNFTNQKSVYIFVLLKFFASIIHTQGIFTQKVPLEDENLCLPLRYKDPYVPDKPDLLIVQATSVRRDHILPMWMGVCRIGSEDLENSGKFLGWFNPAVNNDLEYDVQTDTIYVSTYSYKLKILGNGVSEDVYEYSDDVFLNFKSVSSAAFDWVTKNLYVFLKDEIQVYNIKDNLKSPKTITYFDSEVNNPMIKVFPNEGYLIVLTDNKLTRYNQDGSNSRVLYDGNDNTTIDAVALDYFEKKVYWIETSDWGKESLIRSTDLNGDEIKTFKKYNSRTATCYKGILQIDEKYVYFTKGLCSDNNLFRARKIDGSIDLDFELMESGVPKILDGKFNSILVVSGNPQVIAKNHPCLYKNGDCRGFCVAVPDEFNYLTKKCLDTYINYYKQSGWGFFN